MLYSILPLIILPMLLQFLVVYIHLNKNMLVQKYTNDAKKWQKREHGAYISLQNHTSAKLQRDNNIQLQQHDSYHSSLKQ